jgi:hypothetical protein
MKLEGASLYLEVEMFSSWKYMLFVVTFMARVLRMKRLRCFRRVQASVLQ